MKNTSVDRYDWWFAGVPYIRSECKKLLLKRFQSAEAIYRVFQRSGSKPDCPFLRQAEYNALLYKASEEQIQKSYEEGIQKGIRLIHWYSEEYPGRLKPIEGMPFALFACGELPSDDYYTAAIVGARKCTYYGEKMAVDFAETLSAAGVQIISGMAAGIDGAAQRAALTGGGYSCAVLGCGADICYPRENRGLYEDLKTYGCLLSELAPGSVPQARNFPARNRILSALSDIVLVIEARARSGSLITANYALDYGKDVHALPGPLTSSLSRGCHELIRDGARILISPDELIQYLAECNLKRMKESHQRAEPKKKKLESKEKLLYSSIGLFPKNVSELSAELSMEPSQVLRILTSLEMNGWIREISKNYYVRN